MRSEDPFIRRARAAQKTLDVWSKRPMRLGTSDCVRMAAAHLRLLGHKVRLPHSGSYRTVVSARRQLKALGFASVEAALDGMMERIAPAAAIVGDIIMMPSADGLGSLGVALGGGRVVAYHEDVRTAAVLQPLEYVAAWRALP